MTKLWSLIFVCLAFLVSNANAAPMSRMHSGISDNWAGYVETGGEFHTISGTWVEPTISCPAKEISAAAIWVGLGGFSGQEVEQIGTEADCTYGAVTYHAWWQSVPEWSRYVSLTIKAGDLIHATVTVYGHREEMTLTDLTSGKAFHVVHRTRVLDLTSAEWIVEAPAICLVGVPVCNTMRLANFGQVRFTHGFARRHRQMTRLTMHDHRAWAIPSHREHGAFSVAFRR